MRMKMFEKRNQRLQNHSTIKIIQNTALIAFAWISLIQPGFAGNPYEDDYSVIFSYCDPTTVSKLRVVCKGWKSKADQQDIKDNPFFITTSYLDNSFLETDEEMVKFSQEIAIKGRSKVDQFFQRLNIYRNLLFQRQAHQGPNDNFMRLMNLVSLNIKSPMSPYQETDKNEFDNYLNQRRQVIVTWKGKNLKAAGYYALTLISKDKQDLEKAYTRYKDLNSPLAEQLLIKFINSDSTPEKATRVSQVKEIKKNYLTKKQNYQARSQKSEFETENDSFISVCSTLFTILVRFFSPL